MKNVVKNLFLASLLTGMSTASAVENNNINQLNTDKKSWISIGNDAVTLINNSYNKQFALTDIQPRQSVLN